MNYEKEAHIPQQIELLLQHRADGNLEGFEYILDGVKIIMKSHQDFLDGLQTDLDKRTKDVTKAANDARETILKAFKEQKSLDACQTSQQVLMQLENVYNAIMLGYMNDVIQTCMSYQQHEQ